MFVCNYVNYFTYFRWPVICYIKTRPDAKFSIVPEEGWFGQPKYSTRSKKHSTLCRFLPLYSSFYLWSRLDHYWSNVYEQDHRSGCLLLKHFIDKVSPWIFSWTFQLRDFVWLCIDAKFERCKKSFVPCDKLRDQRATAVSINFPKISRFQTS